MLRELLRKPDQSVSAIASKMRLSRPSATNHLRILAARGLLRARRSGSWVRYRVEPDRTIPEAGRLIRALEEALRTRGQAIEHIYRLATAFTHPRRQAIYEALLAGDCAAAVLEQRTGVQVRALHRHLAKLTARGFVVAAAGVFRATAPPGSVAAVLADLAPRAAR
jgi:DNA-binding transcriptional ArsR family regulator